jgi:glutathione S-transferase
MIELLEFPHSHYCEKARWVLGHKGIDFKAKAIMPGWHLISVPKIATGTSVPVLLDDGVVVQGSTAIIDYLEESYPERPITPTDPEQLALCEEIESNEDALGEDLRSILYHKLLDYPAFIRHCFTHPMPLYKQFVFRLMYPVLKRKIYQRYVVSDEKIAKAKKDFAVAMDEMALRLEGRDYLVGDQFSRADITVASMLSLLALPDEHPFPWQEIPDKSIRDFFDQYQRHPVIEWVNTIYREHR